MAKEWQDETNTITIGRCPFNDGSCYYGQWDQQRFAQGYGCWIGCQKKGKFEGYYKDGLEITGTYTWPSGELYHGQWSNGQRHGFGIQKYKGSVYAGYWNRGICDYLGAMWNRCGSIYFGTWQDGQKTGYGTEAYLDGYYHGQFSRDQRHGYGIRVTYQEQHDELSNSSSPSSSLRSVSSSRLKKKLKIRGDSIFNGDGLFSATTSYSQRKLDIKSRPRLHDEIFDIHFKAQDNDDIINTNCHNSINNNNNVHYDQTKSVTDSEIKSTLPFNCKGTQSKCQTTTTVNIDSSSVKSNLRNQLKDIGNSSRISRSHSEKNFYCKYSQSNKKSNTITQNNDATTPYLTTSNLEQLLLAKTTNKSIKTTTSLKHDAPIDKDDDQDICINRRLRKNHTIDIGEQFFRAIKRHDHIQSNTADIQELDLIPDDINNQELTTFDNSKYHQANNHHTLSLEERSSSPSQHQTMIEKNDQKNSQHCQSDDVMYDKILNQHVHQQSDSNKIKINGITFDNLKDHRANNQYTLSFEERSAPPGQHQIMIGKNDQKNDQYCQSADVICHKILNQDVHQQSESNKVNIGWNGESINVITFDHPKDHQTNNLHTFSLEERSDPPSQHQTIIAINGQKNDQHCQCDRRRQILNQHVHQQSVSNKIDWNGKSINGITFDDPKHHQANNQYTLSFEERSGAPNQHQTMIGKNDQHCQPHGMMDHQILDQDIHQQSDSNKINTDWNGKSITGIKESTSDSADDIKCQIGKQRFQEDIKSTSNTDKVEKCVQNQDNGCHINDDTELSLKYGHDYKIHWKENGINHSGDIVQFDIKQTINRANGKINGHSIQDPIKTDSMKAHPVNVRIKSLGHHNDSNHHHVSNGTDDVIDTMDNHSHTVSVNDSKCPLIKTQSTYSYDWDFNQRDIMEGIRSLQIYINNHQSNQQGEDNPISSTSKTHHVSSTIDHDVQDHRVLSLQSKNQDNNLFSSLPKAHKISFTTSKDVHNTHGYADINKVNHCPSTHQGEGNSVSSTFEMYKLSSMTKNNHDRDIYSKAESNSIWSTTETHKLSSTTKNNHDTDIYSKGEGNSISSIIETHKNNHDTDIYLKGDSNSVSSTIETHKLFSTTKNNHGTDIYSKAKGNSLSSATETHKLSSTTKKNHNTDIYWKGEGNSISNTTEIHKLSSIAKNNHARDIYSKKEGNSISNTTEIHKLSSIAKNNHARDIYSKTEGNSISNIAETRKLSSTTKNNHVRDIYSKTEGNSISNIAETRKLSSTTKNNHARDIYSKTEGNSISNIAETRKLSSTTKNNHVRDIYSKTEGNSTSSKIETCKLSSTTKNNHNRYIYSYTNQSTNQKDNSLSNTNTTSCTIEDNYNTDIDIHYYNKQSRNESEDNPATKIHKLSFSNKKNDDLTSTQQINSHNSQHQSLKSKAKNTSNNHRSSSNKWSRFRQKSDSGYESKRYRNEQKSIASRRRHTIEDTSKHSSSRKSTKNKNKNILKSDVTIDKKQLIRSLSLQSDILRHSEVMSDKIANAYHDEDSIIEIYKGQWCEDKRNGYGICQRSDGLTYIGNWCNNQLSGYGELTLKDGAIQKGFWRDNRLIFSINDISLSHFRPFRTVKSKLNAALFGARTAARAADKRAIIAKIRAALARDHGMIANKQSKQACIAAAKARYVVSQLQSPKRRGSSIETTV